MTIRPPTLAFALLLLVTATPYVQADNPGQASFQKAQELRRKHVDPAHTLQAAQAYASACTKHQHAAACWWLATLLKASPKLHAALRGRKSGTYGVAKLFAKACKLGYGDGCTSLVKEQRGARNLFPLSQTHKTMQKKACRLGSAEACYAVLQRESKQMRKKKLTKRGKRRWKRKKRRSQKKLIKLLFANCKRLSGKDCFLAGHILFQGSFGTRKLSKARKLLARSCKDGYAEGCDYVGLLYGGGHGGKQDFKRSHQAHERACTRGSMDGCVHLGGLMMRGLGGKRDLFGARRLFRLACQKDHAQGCLLLAEMRLRGEGGDRELMAGYRTYQKACRLKHKEACRRAKQIEQAMKGQ